MYNRSITIQTSFFCPEKKSRALNNASIRLRNKKETTTKCWMLKAPNIELVAKQRPQPTSARLQFKGRMNLPPLAPNVENKETHFAVLVVRTLTQIIIPPCLRQQNTSSISFFLSFSLSDPSIKSSRHTHTRTHRTRNPQTESITAVFLLPALLQRSSDRRWIRR